jgi:hypothetical protein
VPTGKRNAPSYFRSDCWISGFAPGDVIVTLTVTFALPPAPLQDRLKLLLAVNALMVSDPDVALLPDQSPEAVQVVASVLFQFSVVDSFGSTVVGLADRLIDGVAGAATITLTVSFALPQDRIKLLFSVNPLIVSEPDVALLPDQSPEAVQLVTLLLFQLNVVEPLADTLDGLADRLTMGALGATTVTLTESLALPPAPLQDNVNAVVLVNVVVASDPEVARAPDQPSDAVHEVALVEDQLSVEVCPVFILEGVTVSDTVGACGFVTVTVTESLAEPSGPMQVRTKVIVLLIGPVPVPDSDLSPVQPSDAVHEVALVDDQSSVTDWPAVTVEGVAVMLTVGAAAGIDLSRASEPPLPTLSAHPLK